MAGRRLTIAYLFNFADFSGGGEASTAAMIDSVRHERVKPIAFVPAPGEIQDHCEARGIETVVCPQPPLRSRAVHRPFLALVKMVRAITSRKVDIIHAAGNRGCLYGGIAGRLTGTPVVWHARMSMKDIFLYDRLLAGLATQLVCVSSAVQSKRFSRFGPGVLAKCRVIHNAVNTDDLHHAADAREQLREKLGIDKNAVVAGLTANITKGKGHDTLMRALGNVRTPITVICAGHDGVDAEFETAVKQSAPANVRFIPFQKDIKALYSALDIFLLPSRSEGFSRSLIEAMSMSLPVIASDLPEIREAVPDEDHALLHSPEDADALAQYIDHLAKDPNQRKKMGQANRQRAKQSFDLAEHGRRITELYGSILTAPRASLRRTLKGAYLVLRRICLTPLALFRSPRPISVDSVLCIAPPRLGDCVMALHALAQVRAAKPNARIEVLAKRNAAEVMKLSPHADKVLAKPKDLYDVVIDLNTEWRLLSALKAVKHGGWTTGYDVAGRAPLYDAPLSGPSTALRVVDAYDRLVRHAVDGEGRRATPTIRPLQMVEEMPTPYVAIVPGATHPTQRWLPEYFGAVADTLAQSGMHIALVGAPSEYELLQTVKRHMRHMPSRIATGMDMDNLFAAIAGASLLIGNNSGPLHVAGCVGIPTISFRGPSAIPHWMPIGPADTVFERPELTCLGCGQANCPRGDLACMQRIHPDAVSRKALEVLHG